MAEIAENTILVGDGIVLRHYRESDAPSLSRHGSNPKIKDRLREGFPHPYTVEDALCWRAKTREPENMLGSGKWTVEKGSEGPKVPVHYAIVVNDEAVGSIGLVPGQNVYFRTAELGYWLSEDHWGKGVMSKAAKAFIKWVWETFDVLVRLNSEASEVNPGSQKVLTKAGFEMEGVRKNFSWKNGRSESVLTYGLLRPT